MKFNYTFILLVDIFAFCITIVLQNCGGDIMAKEATLQVRMDADLKEKVEQLYKDLGTSFAEAVRIFAKQSVAENAMPFLIHVPKQNIRGMASQYANPDLIPLEKDAFKNAVSEQYEKDN